jgi:hypothetical protein
MKSECAVKADLAFEEGRLHDAIRVSLGPNYPTAGSGGRLYGERREVSQRR